jgi:pyruvate formate lyase activating enzyme
MTGIVFDIKRFAIHDGPGIRIAIHLKGCPLSCWWCHNPEGLRQAPQAGERGVTVAGLMAEIEKERVFIDESGGGVTFTGGEPLVQSDFLLAALAACRQADIHTAVDTCGLAAPELLDRVQADLFLYDLKLMDDQAHRHYCGVSNRQILDNFGRLTSRGANVVVRFPVIPGITDTESNLSSMIEFLVRNGKIRQVSLLPYHQAAKAKYRRLQLENKVDEIVPPAREYLLQLQARFEQHGFLTQIGG